MIIMEIQNLLNKIIEDAASDANATLSASHGKAAQIKADSDAKIENMKKNTLLKASNDSVALEERMSRMADLEEKKRILSKKREVLDLAFSKAKNAFIQLDSNRLESFFLDRLLSIVNGGEKIRFGDASAHILNEAFLSKANRLLSERKKTPLLPSNDSFPGFGFVVQNNGLEISCTAESLIDEMRFQLEQEVAQILFQ